MNIFKLIAHEVSHVFKKIFSADTLRKAQSIGEEIEKIIPDVEKVLKMIDLMVPNRVTPELEALAAKYSLVITPYLTMDPIQVSTLLQNAAVKELLKKFPNMTESMLREAIAITYRFYKIEKTADSPAVPVPVTAPVPGVLPSVQELPAVPVASAPEVPAMVPAEPASVE